MTVGIALPTTSDAVARSTNAVDLLIDQARTAAEFGVGGIWLSQRFDVDALTLAAAVAREVPDVAIGTSVVPMYPRHPVVLASQALTVQAASAGRFTLGIGLGAGPVAEGLYGVPYDRPIRHLRDYMTTLRAIFAGEEADVHGPTVTAATAGYSTVVGGASTLPIIVAAMGEQALRAAGELADGTLPFLAGRRTIANTIAPAITAAAQSAGRTAPRIIAAVPAIVTSKVDAVTAAAREELGFYAAFPTYQRILAAEGIDHPAQLALIGDEETVAAGVRAYLEAGATEVIFAQTGLGSRADQLRTGELAGALTKEFS
ncbi:TIGR03564 family F420-dependent LLM class oxidoreductase [Kribbella sp. NPDC058245]|uniref:TIGR03564 family F420-dependent LLM class oxidoreductase n=1 Tax=Kribbella sp. NPDC058245 TaxID=3346399 RepID=UPI0036E93756